MYVSRGSADAVIKPTYGDLDGMILKASVLQNVSFSSNQWLNKTTLLMSMRQARTYLQDLAQHERDKAANRKTTPPKIPADARRYLSLLKGDIFFMEHLQCVAGRMAQRNEDRGGKIFLLSIYDNS